MIKFISIVAPFIIGVTWFLAIVMDRELYYTATLIGIPMVVSLLVGMWKLYDKCIN